MAASNRGDRAAFWLSRLGRGDPLANTAMSIVESSSALGSLANSRLGNKIMQRSPDISSGKLLQEMQLIGEQLMQAHIAAIRTFGSPNAAQIAAYHFAVFEAHGLPADTFGGAAVTGTEEEARIMSEVWLEC